MINGWTERIAELEAEIATMKSHTWCAYCGLEIHIDDDAATKISKHIMDDCPKHPIRVYQRHAEAVEEQNEKLTAEVGRLRGSVRLFVAHHDGYNVDGSKRHLCDYKDDHECARNWQKVYEIAQAALKGAE